MLLFAGLGTGLLATPLPALAQDREPTETQDLELLEEDPAQALLFESGRDVVLSVLVGGQFFVSSDVDPVLDGRRMTGVGLQVGVEAARFRSGSLASDMLLDLEWTRAWAGTKVFGQNETDLLTDWLTVSARYRIKPFSWLLAFVRAGAGYTTGTLGLKGPGGATYDGRGHTGHVLATVGVEFLLPRRVIFGDSSGYRDFSVGLAFEAGYQHTFDLDYGLENRRGIEPDITKSTLQMGALGLSGPIVRGALVIHL